MNIEPRKVARDGLLIDSNGLLKKGPPSENEYVFCEVGLWYNASFLNSLLEKIYEIGVRLILSFQTYQHHETNSSSTTPFTPATLMKSKS